MTQITIPGHRDVGLVHFRGSNGSHRVSIRSKSGDEILVADGDTEREALGRAFEFLTAAAAAVLVRR